MLPERVSGQPFPAPSITAMAHKRHRVPNLGWSPLARPRWFCRWPVALLAALAVGLAGLSSADAAGTVTNCASYGSAGTPGDLAWALQGGGTVTFQCSGTIVVPPITLSQDTVIDSAGRSVTLSGNHANKVLLVNSGVTVELNGITVANGVTAPDAGSGASGAGIYNEGTLTLTDSTVGANTAMMGHGGGIYNSSGSLTLTNSTVNGNRARSISYFSRAGGGIYNDSGTVTLTNSTVSGNHADYGGGIYNDSGTVILTNSTVSGNYADYGGGIYNGSTGAGVILTNSTVSGNTASGTGAGIDNAGTLTLTNSTVSANTAMLGLGGGIYSVSTGADVTLTNSTVSGNTATDGGGIYNDRGTVTLTNSTVSANTASFGGGGISNGGDFTLTNSIIAQQGQGGDCDGAVTSQGYNLDSDGTCQLTAVGDISGGTAGLAPLAINPPGTTATHALDPNSSQALDAIPPGTSGCGTTVTTDQRGVPRPHGVGCDIGAFEWIPTQQTPQTITVTAPAPPSAPYGTVFPVAATASSGLPVAITTTGVCSGSGSGSATVTMTSGTGTCTVHYNQAGNTNYYPAPEVTSDTLAIADTVTIRSAIFANIASTLSVSATSSASPVAALSVTVANCLTNAPMWLSFDGNAYVLRTRVKGCGNLDGQTVTVTSSHGGVATATIQ